MKTAMKWFPVMLAAVSSLSAIGLSVCALVSGDLMCSLAAMGAGVQSMVLWWMCD